MTREEKKNELIALFVNGAMQIGELIDECFEFGLTRIPTEHNCRTEQDIPTDIVEKIVKGEIVPKEGGEE